MHLCLSCNQPCDIASIFCDTCRLSLLEHGTEEQQGQSGEELREENEAGSEGEAVDLLAAPERETRESVPLRVTEGGGAGSWRSSGAQTLETLEEEVDATVAASSHQATNLLVVPARNRMPKPVRRALLVFCIVGACALIVDGILLTLSIMRHHITARPATTMTNPSNMTPAPGAEATSNVLSSAFALSATRLVFTATQGQADPSPQSVTLFDGQAQTFSWNLMPVSSLPTWLHLSAAQGSATGGTRAQVIVSALATQLAPGTYTTSVLAKAFDSQGNPLPGSPQTLTILLTVQVPCSLSVTPEKISFAAVLLSPPAAQTLTLTESGDCTRPVHWQVSADVPWLTFSSSSGTDSGSGSTITVQASSNGKLIGTSTAHVILLATDAHGVPLAGSPATIIATLTVLA